MKKIYGILSLNRLVQVTNDSDFCDRGTKKISFEFETLGEIVYSMNKMNNCLFNSINSVY